MPITGARLRQLNADVDVAILQGAMSAKRDSVLNWDLPAIKKKTSIGKVTYAAMNNILPIQKKGIGGYPFADPAANTNDIISSRIGTGVRIPVDDITDDKWGVWEQIIAEVGYNIERFPQYLIYEWLIEGDQTVGPANTFMAGRSMTWVDGLAFFSATHKTNNQDASLNTYSNYLTGTALNAANLAVATAAFVNLPNTEGKKRGIYPNLLLVPPQLEKTAADLLQALTISTGGFNTQSNDALAGRGRPRMNLQVVPELSGDAANWYLGARIAMSAPVIYQVTEELTLYTRAAPDDDNMFFEDEVLYLSKGRADVGWGDPRLLIRCDA